MRVQRDAIKCVCGGALSFSESKRFEREWELRDGEESKMKETREKKVHVKSGPAELQDTLTGLKINEP